MSVVKYRSAFDMPAPARPTDVARAMAAVWERAHLHGRPELVRGVFKFRDLDEAGAAREQATRVRIAGMTEKTGSGR